MECDHDLQLLVECRQSQQPHVAQVTARFVSQFTGVFHKKASRPVACPPSSLLSHQHHKEHTDDRTERNCLLQTQKHSKVNSHQPQNLQDVRPIGPRLVSPCLQHRLRHTRPRQSHQHAMGKALHNLRRASNHPRTAHRLPVPRCHQGHPVNAVLCLCQPTDDTPAEYLLRCTRPDQGHSIYAVLCLRRGPEV